MDYAAHRQQMLKHCLWLVNLDQSYAKWAARRYEQQSDGVLDGLYARVVQTIDKRNQQLDQPPQPPTGEA